MWLQPSPQKDQWDTDVPCSLCLQICLQLLRHVHSRGVDYRMTMDEEHHPGVESAPKATTHSCLQLLSRLTARHEIALKVILLPCYCLLSNPVGEMGPVHI